MKPLTIVFLIISFCSMKTFSQNRISTWDIEKITSIQVEFKTTSNEKKIEIFKTELEIDRIMSFFISVEFKDLGDSEIDKQGERDNWKFKIDFEGQRDQIYLFENFAFIGRSSFLIDSGVIEDFRKVIEE